MKPEYHYLAWDGSMRVRLDAEPHRELISLNWNMGESLVGVPRISAAVNTKAPPDHMVIGRINYVSSHLKSVLEHSSVNAQFFPVADLRTRRGEPLNAVTFFAMNVLDRVSCIDRERSELEYEPPELGGGIQRVMRLHLLEAALNGWPLVVPSELGGAFMLMRRDVAERLRAAGVRGCRWREIEEFRLPQTTWPEES